MVSQLIKLKLKLKCNSVALIKHNIVTNIEHLQYSELNHYIIILKGVERLPTQIMNETVG